MIRLHQSLTCIGCRFLPSFSFLVGSIAARGADMTIWAADGMARAAFRRIARQRYSDLSHEWSDHDCHHHGSAWLEIAQ